MAFLRIHEIITKVYDLLRQDTRTLDIDWYNGRRSPAQMQQLPGGNVYLGPFSVAAYTIPKGESGTIRVTVELVHADHAGVAAAEKTVRERLDDVAQVLVDNWELGLDYCYPEALTGGMDSEPESSPATAMVRFFLDVKVLPA